MSLMNILVHDVHIKNRKHTAVITIINDIELLYIEDMVEILRQGRARACNRIVFVKIFPNEN